MSAPRSFRKQLMEYERVGFTLRDWRPSKGDHIVAWFHQFPDPQSLTPKILDRHGLQNNISRFRRLAAAAQKKDQTS